jgi:LPXTG-motif cell wall-anchored protein
MVQSEKKLEEGREHFAEAASMAKSKLESVTERGKELIRERFGERGGEIYDRSAEWAKENTSTLAAIGLGALIVGLTAFFVSRRRSE